MDKNVIISVHGKHTIDKESDTIELTTEGTMSVHDDKYIVRYHESEITGLEGTLTTVTAGGGQVVLTREGTINSQMIFERGVKHVGAYKTPFGDMTIGVLTDAVNVDMHESGGTIHVHYLTEFGEWDSSQNDFMINIREALA